MKKIFATILIAVAAFSACEQEIIEQTSGEVPSLEGTDAIFVEVRSSRTLSNVIPVTFIEGERMLWNISPRTRANLWHLQRP